MHVQPFVMSQFLPGSHFQTLFIKQFFHLLFLSETKAKVKLLFWANICFILWCKFPVIIVKASDILFHTSAKTLFEYCGSKYIFRSCYFNNGIKAIIFKSTTTSMTFHVWNEVLCFFPSPFTRIKWGDFKLSIWKGHLLIFLQTLGECCSATVNRHCNKERELYFMLLMFKCHLMTSKRPESAQEGKPKRTEIWFGSHVWFFLH